MIINEPPRYLGSYASRFRRFEVRLSLPIFGNDLRPSFPNRGDHGRPHQPHFRISLDSHASLLVQTVNSARYSRYYRPNTNIINCSFARDRNVGEQRHWFPSIARPNLTV